jgi:mannose-1-phosphate guanylyltransferase
MLLKTAVIIAGGKGTRLEEIGKENPKALVPVAGVPILERIILWLKKNGVENVIIGVAYKKEMIKDFFGNGKKWGLNISYTEHDENGGTEDAFKTAIVQSGLSDKDFYAMNGDQITDLHLEGLTNKHMESGSIATMVTVNMRTNFGVVQIDDKNIIIHLKEKGEIRGLLINSGIYVFNEKIKNYLKEGNIEENTFKKLIEEKKINSFYYDGMWSSFNDKKELVRAETILGKYDSFDTDK